MTAAVLHETFGQVGKHLVEDPPAKAVAHFLGKGLGAEADLIEEGKQALTPGPSPGYGRGESEGGRPEEQPEVAQGNQVVAVQCLGQFDFKVVAGAGVGRGAVQPPILAVGENSPRRLVLLQRPHDADARHVIGAFAIQVVLPIERAVPGIGQLLWHVFGRAIGVRELLPRNLVQLFHKSTRGDCRNSNYGRLHRYEGTRLPIIIKVAKRAAIEPSVPLWSCPGPRRCRRRSDHPFYFRFFPSGNSRGWSNGFL